MFGFNRFGINRYGINDQSLVVGPATGTGQTSAFVGPVNTWPLAAPIPYLPPDLLAAVTWRLRASENVVRRLSSPTAIYFELGKSGADRPFILIQDYDEEQPSETNEDQRVPLTISIFSSNDLDEARALGAAVKTVLDTPNINPQSVMTTRITFIGGQVTGVMRNKSKPRRQASLGRNGEPLYIEQIEYEFWVSPEQ